MKSEMIVVKSFYRLYGFVIVLRWKNDSIKWMVLLFILLENECLIIYKYEKVFIY